MFELIARDRDGVKTCPRFVRARPANVIARGAAQRVDLFRVDIPLGSAKLSGSACLDLDKHKRIALPCHDVDLTAALRRPPVARYDGESVAPEVPMREVFAALP